MKPRVADPRVDAFTSPTAPRPLRVKTIAQLL
jgi:hypothetical protein